jgi:cytosine/adenosine deaminase-related metal-dependent hydrolase
VIEQDQIVAIAPCTKVKAPAGSLIVDGRGKFLIPGLWDMHVHGFSAEPGSRGRIVGNPEVIRKLAPGNRSDGFRSHQASLQ